MARPALVKLVEAADVELEKYGSLLAAATRRHIERVAAGALVEDAELEPV
jgi:hypothetical protein